MSDEIVYFAECYESDNTTQSIGIFNTLELAKQACQEYYDYRESIDGTLPMLLRWDREGNNYHSYVGHVIHMVMTNTLMWKKIKESENS